MGFTFNRVLALPCFLLFGTCFSCGPKDLSQENKAHFPARNQCFSLVDGGTETSEFPETILVLTVDTLAIGRCTGTFVAPNLMLTAAHCVPKDTPNAVRAMIDDCDNNQTVEYQSSAVWHSGVAGEDFDEKSPNFNSLALKDTIVAKFDQDIAPAVNRLPSTSLAKDKKATFIGFGTDTETLSPDESFEDIKKLKGTFTSTTDYKNTAIISHERKSGEATISKGDSGGPLFSDKGEIVAIASFSTSGTKETANWINLFSATTYLLLKRVQEEEGNLENWTSYEEKYKELANTAIDGI